MSNATVCPICLVGFSELDPSEIIEIQANTPVVERAKVRICKKCWNKKIADCGFKSISISAKFNKAIEI